MFIHLSVLKIYFILHHLLNTLYVHVCVSVCHMCVVPRHGSCSLPTWVLRTELGFSERAGSILFITLFY